MKKKLLSILLVLNLMLALVPAAFAADIVDSGTCGAEGDGSSVTWTIDKNGVLTVTGTGAITSDAMQIRQLSNRSDVTSAVIGEGITDMGALWLDYTSLTSVSFPDTITRLKNVCSGCPELTSVRLPAKLESLVGAFTGCKSLTTIALPDTLKFISGSFASCEGLTEVVIPEGVTALGEGVFDGCTNLVRLTLPSTLQGIGSFCFGECRALKSVSIPEGITRLESHLFYNCTGLESISLPASLTSIGYRTFSGARNVKVVCYAGTEEQWKALSLSKDLFSGAKICYEHPDHVFDPLTNTPATCTDDGRIAGTCTVCGYSMDTVLPAYGHDWDKGKVLSEPDGLLCGFIEHTCRRCPDSLRKIGRTAFANNERLRYVQLPAGMQSIETWAFSGSDNITDVCFGGSEEAFHALCDPDYVFPSRVNVHSYSYMVIPGAAELFTDVDADSWAIPGIDFCVLAGLMSGVGGNAFAPKGVTTRAQVVQILYNLSGCPKAYDGSPFTDLTADWYQHSIVWAYQNGIVSGTSATTFEPEAPVTREQIAVILMGYAEKVLGLDFSADKADLAAFPDGASVSDWARDAVSQSVALGLISGAQTKDGTFLQPQGGATREQAATILMGFYSLVDADLRMA